MIFYVYIFVEQTPKNMKKQVFLYLNHSNLVVYANFEDNFVNRNNKQLKRFVLKENDLPIFANYYRLRIHPNTLKNII